MEYNKELPNYGDLFTKKEFIEMCLNKTLIDYDGYGYPVKNSKHCNLIIRPSELNEVPEDCTHVVWFNR